MLFSEGKQRGSEKEGEWGVLGKGKGGDVLYERTNKIKFINS